MTRSFAKFHGLTPINMMKVRRIRVAIFLVIFGMLFISFKILEPEIDGHDNGDRQIPVRKQIIFMEFLMCIDKELPQLEVSFGFPGGQ